MRRVALVIQLFENKIKKKCINPKGIWNKNELKNKTAGEPLFRDEPFHITNTYVY
jgi:hypothetical protein